MLQLESAVASTRLSASIFYAYRGFHPRLPAAATSVAESQRSTTRVHHFAQNPMYRVIFRRVSLRSTINLLPRHSYTLAMSKPMSYPRCLVSSCLSNLITKVFFRQCRSRIVFVFVPASIHPSRCDQERFIPISAGSRSQIAWTTRSWSIGGSAETSLIAWSTFICVAPCVMA